MKIFTVFLVCFFALSSLAAIPKSIVCRDDQRLHNGPLRELILTPTDDSYLLRSQFAASLDSPIVVLNWAEKLLCRVDERSALAFCQNQEGHTVASFTERREVFYDSAEVDAKKKISKNIVISVRENEVLSQAISFAASHCQLLGGAV